MRELFKDFDAARVVHEDADLIVVDKPAYVPSQAAEAEHDDDLRARLRRFLAARDGVSEHEVYLGVHQRLDRDTSGLMLFTRRREANAAIAAQFEGRTIDKTYVAAVGHSEALASVTRLEGLLARGQGGRMEVVAAEDARARGAKRAHTRVRIRAQLAGRALVELGCDTGRTHQLRVQLAHAGAPIAGDVLYGGPPALRLLLHACALRLRHPGDGRLLELFAPPPLELERWVERGDEDASDDPLLFARALELARERRYRLGCTRATGAPTTAFRLLHRGVEGTPQVAVDLYGEHAVAHFFGEAFDSAPEREREARVLDALAALGFAGVYVKRHPKQKNELRDPRDPRYAPAEPLRGTAAAEEFVVYEQGVPFGVRLGDGLRTGLFLDQRDNRARVRRAARDKRVLNLFAYTGGFSVAALAGGAAEALCVDASAAALSWAARNVARIDASARHRTWKDDAFDVLRRLARRGERFQLVIADPPSYATTRGRRFVALRDYAGLIEAAVRVLAPGGTLLACVNHHDATQAMLRNAIARGVEAAGRQPVRLRDLPPQLDFPEGLLGERASKSALLTCD